MSNNDRGKDGEGTSLKRAREDKDAGGIENVSRASADGDRSAVAALPLSRSGKTGDSGVDVVSDPALADADADDAFAADWDASVDDDRDIRREIDLAGSGGPATASASNAPSAPNAPSALGSGAHGGAAGETPAGEAPARSAAEVSASTAPAKKRRRKDSVDLDMFADDDSGSDDDVTAVLLSRSAAEPRAAPGNGEAARRAANKTDDPNGYYNFTPGERIGPRSRYVVRCFVGKGMFSSVLRCTDTGAAGGDVCVKVIRANPVTARAGKEELVTLRRLATERCAHIVQLLDNFEHAGHICLVFEALRLNLREVLRAEGRGVGLHIDGVTVYARQLFAALAAVERAGLTHGDVKPDNICVAEGLAVLKLVDFGSAFPHSGRGSSGRGAGASPYMVSRFYRAPEVIVGDGCGPPADVWAAGCTLFELYTGRVAFPGRSNNDMLRLIMRARGKLPHRLIRRALAAGSGAAAKHFDEQLRFLHDGAVISEIQARNHITQRIESSTPGTASPQDVRRVAVLTNLIERALSVDPAKRIRAGDALTHELFNG